MTTLKLHTPDFTDANIAKLAGLFPNCVTESTDSHGGPKRAIDFDLLRQELSGSVVEGAQERYQLNWVGKREALLTANAPIAKTLRPNRADSVNFDTTENLYIEGDNLDALKLLQETYLNQVKMIYIDPPYNTGNDFIYKDDFAEDTDSYLIRSNQTDEDGNRLVANTEANGRFHSDWLSMMYSRLRLARNLLRDDGVIFISIDDNEQANLKRLCDEVFGESNFIASFAWKKRTAKSDVPFGVSQDYEWIISYTRGGLNAGVGFERKYYKTDDYPDDRWRLSDLTKQTSAKERVNSAFDMIDPKTKKKYPFNPNRVWAVSKDTFLDYYNKGKIVFPDDYDFLKISIPAYRVFESEDKAKALKNYGSEEQKKVASTFLPKEVGMSEHGNKEILSLFDVKLFSFPKPSSLINYFISISDDKNAIILDFFSGSATTAHAVMQLNAEDGGQRKFIMVQIPEPCAEKSEAFKAGYKTITEIGKERIRRAGQKIKTEHAGKPHIGQLDIGFRVLKIDSSNLHDVYYSPDQTRQTNLLGLVDNVRADRTDEDLLFQVLLDWGVDLTLPIRQETLAGHTVFIVTNKDVNEIAACFDRQGGITEDFIRQLAALKPSRAVFCDAGFASDSVKINVNQLFKLLSPPTKLKTM